MEIFSLVLNAILSGGIIVTLVTLKATRKKADLENDKATLENEKNSLDTFREYIVEPLKSEVSDLRVEVKELRQAISRIAECQHADSCPVRDELQRIEN